VCDLQNNKILQKLLRYLNLHGDWLAFSFFMLFGITNLTRRFYSYRAYYGIDLFFLAVGILFLLLKAMGANKTE